MRQLVYAASIKIAVETSHLVKFRDRHCVTDRILKMASHPTGTQQESHPPGRFGVMCAYLSMVSQKSPSLVYRGLEAVYCAEVILEQSVTFATTSL